MASTGADFWNGILRDHAKVTKAVTPRTYRGWSIGFDYGYYNAIGPDYDASWEGEDGWVDNGQRVDARTLEGLREEIDAWIEEHAGEAA